MVFAVGCELVPHKRASCCLRAQKVERLLAGADEAAEPGASLPAQRALELVAPPEGRLQVLEVICCIEVDLRRPYGAQLMNVNISFADLQGAVDRPCPLSQLLDAGRLSTEGALLVRHHLAVPHYGVHPVARSCVVEQMRHALLHPTLDCEGEVLLPLGLRPGEELLERHDEEGIQLEGS